MTHPEIFAAVVLIMVVRQVLVPIYSFEKTHRSRREYFRGMKYNLAYSPVETVRREAALTLGAAVPYLLLTVLVLQLQGRGLTRIYFDFHEWGWTYAFAIFFAHIFLHDTYFYWLHRGLHHRRLRWVGHHVHHQFRNPTALGAQSEHPFEATATAFYWVLLVTLVPMHPAVLAVGLVWHGTANAFGHRGFGPGRGRHRAALAHHRHHHHADRCYGLYTAWWDRRMGTSHAAVEARRATSIQGSAEVTIVTRSRASFEAAMAGLRARRDLSWLKRRILEKRIRDFHAPAVDTRPEAAAMSLEDAQLVSLLLEAGVRARAVAWDDPGVDWSKAGTCLLRSAWDWHLRREEFDSWLRKVGSLPLQNPPEVLSWAIDKTHLIQLGENGVPVVSTVHLTFAKPERLEALLSARGWDQVVLKPSSGQSSHGVVRVSRLAGPGFLGLEAGQAHLEKLLASGGALIQEYLGAVTQSGELSLVLIEGKVTHAVRRRPRKGDFLAYGEPLAPEEPVDPAPEERQLAESILATAAKLAGKPILFGRVDLIVDPRGKHALTDIELVCPRLFLRYSPEACRKLVEAIRKAGRNAVTHVS